MLINFTVENFRSFGEEQTLNMVAAARVDHPNHLVPIPGTDKSALRCGVVYGANAAGKSNLVRAIEFAQDSILGRRPIKTLAIDSHLFNDKEATTSFEFRSLSDGQLFVYGFSATKEGVVEEWLDAASGTGSESKVFARKGGKISSGRLSVSAFDRKVVDTTAKVLRALKDLGVKNDQLLLNRIVELPEHGRGELLDRVVRWFAKSLTVIRPDSHALGLVDLLADKEGFRRFCGGFLKNVGTGIDGLEVVEKAIDAGRLPKELLERLADPNIFDELAFAEAGQQFALAPDDPTKVHSRHVEMLHSVDERSRVIPFKEESDGTQRCLHLLPALYDLTQGGRVFIVDEIDRSLHPLLCHALLKLYLATSPDSPGQMIVTTHEAHLLDLDLLRPDEIWFVEKDRRQQSRISSLSDWKIRDGINIKDGYLHGRFGGIPFIGDTKKLMDMIQRFSNGTRNETKAAP